ncbi:high affinity immunoglobulin gamma Fc receptor I-like [Scomber scombrus]|uniref:high affinity immunoglobulin gamma Fc receptor I-like n=1 Tax=Scomber scombrus TaxID=13677 RepID=UPI002DDC882D|nr:high affinity immunoglobulin gamma Fc receptor I-like [Scomber scombrus]
MDTVIALLVLSTIPLLVVPEVPSVASFRAVVELVSGDSRIFSGESVRLRCSIPDVHGSTWTIEWFKGSKKLSQNIEHLTLWKAFVSDSGKFYCQGLRDTLVGNIRTLPSLPVEINVDGGWAILEVPPRPALVGETLTVTCRVRGNPVLQEVILYKDGVEVMRQSGLNPHPHLTNLAVKDQGLYSCRASWDIERRTRSVISVETQVLVSEVVTQPYLEIVADDKLVPANMIKLVCHVEYNARAPAPPINYYFYKNNKRLGTATSENHDLARRVPGHYSCKAKVPVLGIFRLSEPKSFGEVKEPQMMTPPALHPRDPRPLAPTVPNPDLSLLPAAEPTAAWSIHQQSAATPTIIQPTGEHAQPSPPLLKPSQPAPSTPLSTVTEIVTPEVVTISEGSGDM